MRSAARAGLLALVAALCSSAVIAQQPPTPPEPVAPPTQAAPASQPGFFDAVGRWFDQGADNFRKFNEKAQENSRALTENAADARRKAANATKDAIDSVSRLPNTRVVKGNERCELAANGAPDCQAAAEALCRKQGFQTGKSLEFTSAEQCPTRMLLSGRQSVECTTVTFISRAMCQ